MTKYIDKLPYWHKLSKVEQRHVSETARVNSYKQGQVIHGCDEDCLGQILVLNGEIRTFLLSEEGREVTLFRLREGDACVLSASCVISEITFDTQMTATVDTQVLVVNTGVFAALTESNIYVRCFMYELATKRFSQVMWAMQQILFNAFDKRLATFLITEARETGSNTIKMTHEQVAQHVSSAREVVARMLKRFAADGLVEYKRASITILNYDELEQLAED